MPNSDRVDLYPLQFMPLPKEKVWGGTRMATLFPDKLPAGRPVGELWVVWDQLVVENGAWRGKTLAELVRAQPGAILGSRFDVRGSRGRQGAAGFGGQGAADSGGQGAADSGGQGAADTGDQGARPFEFPLLVKLLDTQQTLSVQVHPDDRYAQEQEAQPFGKAEVWVVLEAEPGARLIHGVHCPLTRAEAEVAIRSGRLRDLVEYVEVDAGDVIMNPPGTIHALGEGILLYELQQSSDLTYRLYDWDRNDPSRQLHIARSLDVADLLPLSLHKTRPVAVQEPGASRTFLCACKDFAAEQVTVKDRVVERPAGACFHILTVLQGSGSVRCGTSPEPAVALRAGESVLVPASVHEYLLCAEGEPLVVIKAYVPDLAQDIVLPLQRMGVAPDAIVQLGGDPRHSDLAPYLHGEM